MSRRHIRCLQICLLTLAASAQNRDAAGYLRNYPPVAQSVPLEPKLKALLDAAGPTPSYSEMPIAQVRALVNKRILSAPRMNDRIAHAENRQIPGPRGRIPIRIYTPEGAGPFPVLAFFHGGGWVLGNVDTHDDYCRSLCSRARAVVVSVDYRLSPEHRFPAPVEDCYAALKWAAQHAKGIGADGERFAVAGDSAGGNLSAAVALMARDKGGPTLALQVLLYPATSDNLDTASYHQNATGFGLSRDAMIFYWKSYLSKLSDGGDAYASPLKAGNLSGAPRTLVITAQYDPLRDDGLAYAARLSRAAVPVRCTNYLDMNHGFALFAAVYDSAKKALEEVTGELQSAFGGRR